MEPAEIAQARRKLAEAEQRIPSADPSLVPHLNALSKALADHGRFAEAQQHLERSLSIQIEATGPDSLETADALNTLAVNHCLQFRYYEAVPLFERALNIRRANLGGDHPEVARLLNNLGSLYTSIGLYTRSEDHLALAMEIYKKHGMEGSESAFKVMSNMIGLYKETGRNGAAEETALAVFEMAGRLFGQEHPLYATTLNNLAEAHAVNGSLKKAEELVKRGIELKRRQSEDHPELVYYYNNLADIYRRQDKFVESEAAFKEALALGSRVLGPSHPLVGSTHLGLGSMYEFDQEPARAESEFQAAMAILEKSLGPEHPDVAAVQLRYGSMMLAENRPEQAEKLLQKALATLERALGPKHPKVREVLSRLAQAELEMGDAARAKEYLRRMNEISGPG
jgi:tetratricopeptide (TPR) repeat protein